jgi:DNA-binding Xre family transcriptional regulator
MGFRKAAMTVGCSLSALHRWCTDQGIAEYPETMTTRRTRTAIKRPGAGVDIDRKRLIRMREVRLLSRAQLAEKMSAGEDEFTITPDAIAKIENGYRRPKTATLSRLCEALDCEPEELLPAAAASAPRTPLSPARRACPHCSALYGHEPGCRDAT